MAGSEPIEVLHLVGSAARSGTSIAGIVRALGAIADPARWRISVWFVDEDGPLREELAEVCAESRFVPWRGRTDVVGARQFYRALQDKHIGIIHRHSGGRSLALMLRSATKAKLVTHVHGLDERGAPQADRVVRHGTDLVIVTGSWLANLPFPRPLRVIHPGIEIDRTVVITPGPPDGEAVIGAAGRLVPAKGYEHLISALALVRQEMPEAEARLEIAGDGPHRPALEAAARRLGVESAVRFLGWLPEPAILDHWTVFVQPSIAEPFGLTVLEAMGRGIPVVASNVGGLRDLVQNGVTGRLVTPGDDAELASALVGVLAQPDLRQSFRQAARRRAETSFTRERMVEQILGAYDDLLPGGGRDPSPRPPTVARETGRTSVVVATRLRPHLLDRCLESVRSQDCQPDEIIVVDNSDGDAATLAAATRHGATYVVEPIVGQCRSRNVGARRATGDVVVFLDDDVVVRPGWLDALTAPFGDPSVDVVTGRIVPGNTDPAMAAWWSTTGWMDHGPESRSFDRNDDDWFEAANFGGIGNGPNMAFRRHLWDTWPGFRESLGHGTPVPGGDEHYAFFELLRTGSHIAYAADSVVEHPHPDADEGIRALLIRIRSQGAAHVTMLLVEEPSFRWRTLRYLRGGRRQFTPSPRQPVHDLRLGRRDAVAATLIGPVRYLQARAQARRRALIEGGARRNGGS